MSDPALSQPPFIPVGTFRCCICMEVWPENHAHKDGAGQAWDMCQPCGAEENPNTEGWDGYPHVPNYIFDELIQEEVAPCGCRADEWWCGCDLAIALTMIVPSRSYSQAFLELFGN